MRQISIGVQWLIRLSGLLQLALGAAIWAGSALAYLPAHITGGLAFVVLLAVQAALAAFAGVSWRPVVLLLSLALIAAVFGMTQARGMPGDPHWIVQVPHRPGRRAAPRRPRLGARR